MYKIELSRGELQLVRWALQVAGDTLALDEIHPPEQRLELIAVLEHLDAVIMGQVEKELVYDRQLRLFDTENF